MLFEALLIILLGGGASLFIGIPTYKFVRAIIPKKRNPLLEAKERLELARLEAEAAKLNKETEKLYDNLYEDTLQDDEVQDEQNRRKL